VTDKASICTRLKDDILSNIGTLSHRELIAKKVELLNNIPGSGGVWYHEISLLCSLIDNKIVVDHFKQSAWDRWGRPLLVEVLKAFVVAAIPFVAGLLLGSQFPDLLSTLDKSTITQELIPE